MFRDTQEEETVSHEPRFTVLLIYCCIFHFPVLYHHKTGGAYGRIMRHKHEKRNTAEAETPLSEAALPIRFPLCDGDLRLGA